MMICDNCTYLENPTFGGVTRQICGNRRIESFGTELITVNNCDQKIERIIPQIHEQIVSKRRQGKEPKCIAICPTLEEPFIKEYTGADFLTLSDFATYQGIRVLTSPQLNEKEILVLCD